MIDKIKGIIPNQIINFITQGHSRSVRAKKNIVVSLFVRGINIGIGILLVPLVLNYLDQTRYGIWLTMSSIVAWFGIMNIGLGNGLRNKFAEAKAKGEYEKARIYVSTTYAILSIIIIAFFIIFLFLNNYLPWSKILNVEQEVNADLSILALIIFGTFSLRFVTQLIIIILVADQKPAIQDVINLFGKILILITIFTFTRTVPSSLIYIGLAYSGLPVLVIIISSFYFFNTKYKFYAPSLKYVDFKYFRDLIGLGWKFFIIQIAVIIMLFTDNIIITQIFGPKQVTPYQIAHKYVSIFILGFGILISPFWSATTEALAKGDYNWIKNTIKKYLNFWYILFIVIVLWVIVSPVILNIWIGSSVTISILLISLWALNAIIISFNSIFVGVVNGSGKIKPQMIIAIIQMFINIPLSIFLAKYLNMGISGVIAATNICLLISALVFPVQVYKRILIKR